MDARPAHTALEVENGDGAMTAPPPARRAPWRLRDVAWREVFKRQDFANWLLTLCLIAALIIVTVVATPTQRAFFISDPSISYTPKPNTVPSWVAVLVPLVMLGATVLAGELLYSGHRQHKSVTDAVATVVFFFFDGVQSLIMCLLLTQVFKSTAGRLRPGFLSICQPVVPPNTTTNSLGLPLALEDYPCTDDSNDSRMSFPSGHASTTFNLTVYASAYLIWCWHMRFPWAPHRLSFWEEFRIDLGNVAAKVWMLAMLSFSWGVAVSRTLDYQHNFSDVLGGMIVGTMIALVYVLRAIPRYRRVLSPAPDHSAGSPCAPGAQAGGAATDGTPAGAWGSGKRRPEAYGAGGGGGGASSSSETPLALQAVYSHDAV